MLGAVGAPLVKGAENADTNFKKMSGQVRHHHMYFVSWFYWIWFNITGLELQLL